MDCGNIQVQCEMKPLLTKLYRARPKTLGRLGPATFEPILTFLHREVRHARLPRRFPRGQKTLAASGDVHGDLLVCVSVLRLAQVVDGKANWTGGSTQFVFCGDLLDRTGRGDVSKNTSHNPREEVDIIQYLHALDSQARAVGGSVTAVLGNHELATVWLEDYPHYERYQHSPQTDGWGGYAQKRKLFQPGGLMARYLSRQCPLILQVESVLFMHGGLTMDLMDRFQAESGRLATVRNLNAQTAKAMWTRNSPAPRAVIRLARVRDLSAPDASVPAENAKCVAHLRQIFARLRLDWTRGAIVVGHTVQASKTIPAFCNGKVWRLDLGMSEAFGTKSTLGVLKMVVNHRALGQATVVTTLSHQVIGAVAGTSVRKYVNGNMKFSKQVSYSSAKWSRHFA